MTTFDLSSASTGFDMTSITAVDFNTQDGQMNASGYSWLSDDGHDIVILGSGFTYSGADVTGGTVTSTTIDLGNNGVNDISITGIPNGSAVDMSNGGASGNVIEFYADMLFGDDTVIGSAFADTLKGLGGDDSITGGNGADSLIGDAGADTLNGGSGNDELLGGNGNDILIGGFATDDIDGGNGDDSILIFDGEFIDNIDGGDDTDTLNLSNIVTPGEEVNINLAAGTFDGLGPQTTITGVEIIVGTQLNDTLTGSIGADWLIGSGGDDIISGGFGNDTLNGGAGNNDTVDFSYSSATININLTTSKAIFTGSEEDIFNFENVTGGSGDETITGTADVNILTGNNGDDRLLGGAGNDSLFAGFGDDRAEGGSGEDVVLGGPGKDTLLGGGDDDTLGGSNASDLMRGDAGRDLILGSNGNDRLFGGAAADTLLGGNGRDTLNGGQGPDRLDGGGNAGDLATYEDSNAGVFVRLWAGDGAGGDAEGDELIDIEFLRGSAFGDTLQGTNDLNRIEGGAGNDLIQGLAGDDFLVGQAGADTLVGGAGDDQFWHVQGDGADTITDFTPGPGDDLVRLFGYGAAFDTFGEVIGASSQSGSDVIIDFGGGDTITLQNTTLASLTAADFVFG